MNNSSHVTVGEVSRLFCVESWRVRRIVDELDDEIPRAGQYRLIPRSLLTAIAHRLEERGWTGRDPDSGATQGCEPGGDQ